MSKMDNLRALREARYEQDRAAAATASRSTAAPIPRRTAARPAVAPPAEPTKAAKPATARKTAKPGKLAEPVEPAAGSAAEPCGHRNMSGRTCTRPAGHAEKNHRYA